MWKDESHRVETDHFRCIHKSNNNNELHLNFGLIADMFQYCQ